MAGADKEFPPVIRHASTPRRMAGVFARGLLMGTADIIPGVSGGTIAFITGIYEELIGTIRSVDRDFLRQLRQGRVAQAVARLNPGFTVPLLAGIGLSLLLMARVVHFLLEHYPVPLWSFFFGLIAASVVVVGRRLGPLTPQYAGLMLISAAAAYSLVGLIPMQTPDTWWFVLLSGMVAISAMLLPGISGAFILVVLGKYAFVTGALRDPLNPVSLGIIAIFGVGCVLGMLGFARVVHFALQHYHRATLSVLTGLMLGAMRKVWPWKEIVHTEVVQGKTMVLESMNYVPDVVDAAVLGSVGLMLVGALAVLLVERLARSHDTHKD